MQSNLNKFLIYCRQKKYLCSIKPAFFIGNLKSYKKAGKKRHATNKPGERNE